MPADVLPDQKAAEVRTLQDEGKIVGMVGDGIAGVGFGPWEIEEMQRLLREL